MTSFELLKDLPLIQHNSSSTTTTTTVDQLLSSSNNNNIDHLLLYFSASWCPPCHKFTPQLVEFYERYHKDKKFEIILLSGDVEQSAFDDYFAKMPFFAMPFDDPNKTRAKLSALFNVEGIPTLIVLKRDARNNELQLVTELGVDELMNDEQGEHFPWQPKTFVECLGSSQFLIGAKQEAMSHVQLSDYDAVGLYFSAHWCPPCRMTTPLLANVYQQVNKEKKRFEVIFVSSDHSQEQFEEYFAEMPWAALPLKDERVHLLNQHFRIDGIPALVMFDPKTNKIINDNAVGMARSDPDGSQFPWVPLNVEVLEPEVTNNHFNDHSCFILFSDKVGAEQQEDNKQLIQRLADKYVTEFESRGLAYSKRPIYFLHAIDSPVIQQVRKFCGVEDENEAFVVIFSGEANFKIVHRDLAFDSLDELVKDYIADHLEGEPLFDLEEEGDDEEDSEDDEE